METIDIVMTTYNGEAFVAEQLDSLLAQTYADLRILVFFLYYREIISRLHDGA